MTVCIQVTNQGDKDTQLKKLLGFNTRVIEAWALRPEKAAEMVDAEKTAAAEAAGKAAGKAAEVAAAPAAAEVAAAKKSSMCALL